MKKGKGIALLPIGVFLVLYLGLGILFEYVMEIPMGFYNVPIVVAFLAAILVACLQNRALDFRFSVSVLFIVACFVSVAMGTSVGTITLLTPIAAAVSTASGFDLAFCVASVMGGAMFGDNLSFISDTTIAACNGQGCEMKDKFRENFWIALPAAVATLILILILSFQTEIQGRVIQPYHLTQVIPYVLVLIGGIVGINVFVVLLTGIVSGAFIMLIGGHTTPVEILKIWDPVYPECLRPVWWRFW